MNQEILKAIRANVQLLIQYEPIKLSVSVFLFTYLFCFGETIFSFYNKGVVSKFNLKSQNSKYLRLIQT